MRFRLRLRAATLTAVIALPASQLGAQSWTLDFTGLPFAQAIPVNYGSVPSIVDVSYAHRAGWGNAAVDGTGAYGWPTNYNDLVDVIFSAAGVGVGEVTLDNLTSGVVTFNSADVGAWNTRSVPVSLRVYDGLWNLLYTNVGVTNGSTAHAHFAPFVSDADMLHIQWSEVDTALNPIDAFNTGIDNVAFTIGAAPVTSTPEPATLGLFGVGLAVLSGVVARRRALPA